MLTFRLFHQGVRRASFDRRGYAGNYRSATPCFAATVSADGRPNLSLKGTLRVWDRLIVVVLCPNVFQENSGLAFCELQCQHEDHDTYHERNNRHLVNQIMEDE